MSEKPLSPVTPATPGSRPTVVPTSLGSPVVEVDEDLAAYYEKLALPDEILALFGCEISYEVHIDILKSLNIDPNQPSVAKIKWDSGPISMAEWWRRVCAHRSLPQLKKVAEGLGLLTAPLVAKVQDKYRYIFFVLAGLSHDLKGVRTSAVDMLPCVKMLLAAYETQPSMDSHSQWFSMD